MARHGSNSKYCCLGINIKQELEEQKNHSIYRPQVSLMKKKLYKLKRQMSCALDILVIVGKTSTF